jgi:hypothetical protein
VSTFAEQELTDAIREIAEANPDHTYSMIPGQQACAYVPVEGQPYESCIVGRALVGLGVPERWLERRNSLTYRQIRGDLMRDGYLSAPRFAIESPVDLGYWIGLVQSDQDRLRPWGTAVANADCAPS